MFNNSTYINKTTTSRLKSMNIEKITTYDFGKAQKWGGVKPIIGIPTLSLLIIGSPMAVQK
jgi:hypothetical protein